MTDTPAEKAEARAIRRRWVTIGEIVAVAGVVIAGLSLWMSWREQRSAEAERAIAASQAAAARARLELRAALVEDGRQIQLSDPAQEILETRIAFPSALRVGQRAPMTPRIDRDWFATAVLAATDGGADVREGRLPVLVTIGYGAGEAMRRDRAIVELVWSTNGRLLVGRRLRLEAARVRERGGDQARIDALWSQELARLKAG